jgi:hypothetical protein
VLKVKGEEIGRRRIFADEPPHRVGGCEAQRAAARESKGKQWPHHGQ